MLKKAEKRLDPRQRRTRRLLLQSLMDLLGEKNFQSITVQDLAARATVNRATFYAHFEDKYTLLEYVIGEIFREALQAKLPEGSHFSPENLQRLILAVYEFVGKLQHHCVPSHKQLFEPLMETQVKTQAYQVLLAWLGEQVSGRRGQGATPELAAMAASWAIYGAAHQWSRADRPEPVSEFVQQVFPMIMAGLNFSATVPAG